MLESILFVGLKPFQFLAKTPREPLVLSFSPLPPQHKNCKHVVSWSSHVDTFHLFFKKLDKITTLNSLQWVYLFYCCFKLNHHRLKIWTIFKTSTNKLTNNWHLIYCERRIWSKSYRFWITVPASHLTQQARQTSYISFYRVKQAHTKRSHIFRHSVTPECIQWKFIMASNSAFPSLPPLCPFLRVGLRADHLHHILLSRLTWIRKSLVQLQVSLLFCTASSHPLLAFLLLMCFSRV